MRSTYPIRQISRGQGPAVHRNQDGRVFFNHADSGVPQVYAVEL